MQSLAERLLWCYETLLDAYGPQGWWPAGHYRVKAGRLRALVDYLFGPAMLRPDAPYSTMPASVARIPEEYVCRCPKSRRRACQVLPAG
jgi:hypothetical protein